MLLQLMNAILFIIFSYFMTVINIEYYLSGIESYIFFILSLVIIVYPLIAFWKIIHEKDLNIKKARLRPWYLL